MGWRRPVMVHSSMVGGYGQGDGEFSTFAELALGGDSPAVGFDDFLGGGQAEAAAAGGGGEEGAEDAGEVVGVHAAAGVDQVELDGVADRAGEEGELAAGGHGGDGVE